MSGTVGLPSRATFIARCERLLSAVSELVGFADWQSLSEAKSLDWRVGRAVPDHDQGTGRIDLEEGLDQCHPHIWSSLLLHSPLNYSLCRGTSQSDPETDTNLTGVADPYRGPPSVSTSPNSPAFRSFFGPINDQIEPLALLWTHMSTVMLEEWWLAKSSEGSRSACWARWWSAGTSFAATSIFCVISKHNCWIWRLSVLRQQVRPSSSWRGWIWPCWLGYWVSELHLCLF